jgi:hypothetical protein
MQEYRNIAKSINQKEVEIKEDLEKDGNNIRSRNRLHCLYLEGKKKNSKPYVGSRTPVQSGRDYVSKNLPDLTSCAHCYRDSQIKDIE